MDFLTLQTPRLILRRVTPEDMAWAYRTLTDLELMEFFGFATVQQLHKERDKFERGIVTHNRSLCNFQLIDWQRKVVIGNCGFHTWAPDHRRSEIGYHLNDDAWKRQGYMTEALGAVLKYGFTEMDLNRIEALVAPDNEASIRLLKRFGFVFEGTLREHYIVNGIPEASDLYSLLKRESSEK